jgi:hypothetical protein
MVGMEQMLVLVDNDSNACALTFGHIPCKMEMNEELPNWDNCHVFNHSENANTLRKILDEFKVFPRHGSGIHAKEWFRMVMDRCYP